MAKILVSINPEYATKILSGEKKFEYRTRVAKKDVQSLLAYETSPLKRVVAEAEVLDVLELPPEELWHKSKEQGGINKEFFDHYFKGREVAFAYHLGKVTIFDNPLELSSYGIKAAPQSFVYTN